MRVWKALTNSFHISHYEKNINLLKVLRLLKTTFYNEEKNTHTLANTLEEEKRILNDYSHA